MTEQQARELQIEINAVKDFPSLMRDGMNAIEQELRAAIARCKD